MSQKKQTILICAQWGGDSNGSARQTPKAACLDPGSGLPRPERGCKRKCFDTWVTDGGSSALALLRCRGRGCRAPRALSGAAWSSAILRPPEREAVALEGACGGEGDFTPLPGPVRKGAQAGDVQKAPAASLGLLVPLPAAGCGEGGMGRDGMELQEMSWAKALVAGPGQLGCVVNSPKLLGNSG